MVTLCWAVKGGSGTTVVTSTLALESTRPALLVDLDGEIDNDCGAEEDTGTPTETGSKGCATINGGGTGGLWLLALAGALWRRPPFATW